ncbi:hypothetical protein ABPG74_020428 [Tetrahymena malaccensis]
MPSITKKILSNCDVFGSPIGLNFEKGNIYRTTFGAVISVVFAVFMGLFFWNTISQFIAKGNLLIIPYDRLTNEVANIIIYLLTYVQIEKIQISLKQQ